MLRIFGISVVRLLVVLLLALRVGCEVRTLAVTVSLGSVDDRSADDANFNGVWDTWQPANDALLAYNGSSCNIRAALEFDLAGIPAHATINSATLQLRYHGASGSPAQTLQFNSYPGNGVVDFADFSVNNQVGPLFNAFLAYDNTGYVINKYYNVPVTSAVQSLLQSGGLHAGFMVENIATNQTAFYSSQATTSAYRPALLIEYTPVPEPSTLTLLGVGAIGLLAYGWRRRRASREASPS